MEDRLAEARMGLNVARNMLQDGATASSAVHELGTSLKKSVIHASESTENNPLSNRGERLGPGCYQVCRFDPLRDLGLVWKWPREYTLRFRADRELFLLGAAVTETHRHVYAPHVKYLLSVRGAGGEELTEGSEVFISKRCHYAGANSSSSIVRSDASINPKQYSPQDVAFK